tara:strand:- start:47 stop:223 length:177 start_codon:yes stop_codon:yes gene_type:complete
MNGLRIHGVENIKVISNDFDSFKTIVVTVTDEANRDFELTLFTNKGFTPNLEVEDGDA